MDKANQNLQVKQKNAAATEIDLLEVFYVLLQRLWILILCFVIGAAAMGIGTKLFVTPQYRAASTIYIYSKTTSITSLADLQIGSALTVDFQIIGTTREVIQEVIDELSLNMSYSELVDCITITNPSSSHMLKITVENPDPVLAANISNTLADCLREQIAEVMNTDKPASVERAVVPAAPFSPNVVKNAAMGGMAFLLIAAAIILLRYFMDDTIQTEDDVMRYLGLNTLAAIPLEHGQGKKKQPAVAPRRDVGKRSSSNNAAKKVAVAAAADSTEGNEK